MRFSLLPKIILVRVTQLTPEYLQSRDIHLLMLDFDNTLIPYTTDIATEETEQWLRSMDASQVLVCVVSNSRNERVKRFCARYGLACITKACKPFPGGIRKCMAQYGISPRQCALVGDQIFTDTLGANLAGVTSILVKPIHNHNFWLKLRHVAEQPFIFAARKRRINR